MILLNLILQIGELLKGKYNRDGLIQLILFIIMGAIVIGFGAVIVYQTFKKKKDK